MDDQTHVAGAPVVNPANVLTALRMILVPVFLLLLLHDHGTDAAWRWAAFATFAVAAATDRIDGKLARERGWITDVGALADPIADKALTGSALVALSYLGDIPWLITIIVLIREVGITALRLALARRRVIPAGRGGKLKAAVQMLALGLYVAPPVGPIGHIRGPVLAVAVVLTVVTGIDYVVRIMRGGL